MIYDFKSKHLPFYALQLNFYFFLAISQFLLQWWTFTASLKVVCVVTMGGQPLDNIS